MAALVGGQVDGGGGVGVYEGVGYGEVAVEGVDAAVELFFGDDERGGYDEVRDPGLDDDTFGHAFGGDLIDQERGAGDFVGVVVEGLFGEAILDELYGPEEAFAADIADGGVFGFESLEFRFDVGGKLGGAFDEVESAHFVDDGDGGGRGSWDGLRRCGRGRSSGLGSSCRFSRWWRKGRAACRRW